MHRGERDVYMHWHDSLHTPSGCSYALRHRGGVTCACANWIFSDAAPRCSGPCVRSQFGDNLRVNYIAIPLRLLEVANRKFPARQRTPLVTIEHK